MPVPCPVQTLVGVDAPAAEDHQVAALVVSTPLAGASSGRATQGATRLPSCQVRGPRAGVQAPRGSARSGVEERVGRHDDATVAVSGKSVVPAVDVSTVRWPARWPRRPGARQASIENPSLLRDTGTVLSAMAPARRRLVLAVAVLMGSPSSPRECSVTVHALHGTPPSSASAAVPQDQPGPVLLVPGSAGRFAELNQLAAALRSGARTSPSYGCRPRPGRPAHPGPHTHWDSDRGTGPHRRALGRRRRLLRRRGRGPLWVAGPRRRGSARRVVTLGSPHHGTDLAGWAPLSPAPARSPASSCCPTAPCWRRSTRRRDARPARVWSRSGPREDRRGPAAGLRPPRRGARLLRCRASARPPRAHGDLPTDAVCAWPHASAPSSAAGPPYQRRADCVGSARDVLGGEVGPGRAEKHHDVDALQQHAAHDVAPQDRVAEQVDERQPVARRQVRLQRRARRPGSAAATRPIRNASAPSAAPSGRVGRPSTGTARSPRRRASTARRSRAPAAVRQASCAGVSEVPETR